MSEPVKRYNAKLASFDGQFRVVVLASDFDALAERCRELESEINLLRNALSKQNANSQHFC